MILFSILAAVAALTLLISYICYRMAFYAPAREPIPEDVIEIPEGEIYEPYRELMEGWIREARALPHEDMEITSFDGLTLRGKFYEYAPGAPIELMFHGYRGSAERDLPGAGHGLSYPVAPEKYLDSLREFFGPECSCSGR